MIGAPHQALLEQGAYSRPASQALPFERSEERAGQCSPWSQPNAHSRSHILYPGLDRRLFVRVYWIPSFWCVQTHASLVHLDLRALFDAYVVRVFSVHQCLPRHRLPRCPRPLEEVNLPRSPR